MASATFTPLVDCSPPKSGTVLPAPIKPAANPDLKLSRSILITMTQAATRKYKEAEERYVRYCKNVAINGGGTADPELLKIIHLFQEGNKLTEKVLEDLVTKLLAAGQTIA